MMMVMVCSRIFSILFSGPQEFLWFFCLECFDSTLRLFYIFNYVICVREISIQP